VKHNSLESTFRDQAAGAYATALRVDEDLSALNQRCDRSRRSIDAVEGTQTAMMEQMSEFMERLKRLEESCAAKDERICVLEGKVEEGEQTLSRCVDALELLSVKVCWCNDDVVALGSGVIEELSELEYASEDGEGEEEEEEFRTPPPDLMTLVIKGHTPQGMFPVTINLTMMADNIIVQREANHEGQVGIFSNLRRKTHPFLASCSCPKGTTGFGDEEDSSSSEGSSSNDSYVEAPLENAQVRGHCFSYVVEKTNSCFRPYLCFLRWKEHWFQWKILQLTLS